MSTERIIERVRKMLALSKDSAATDGERENALRMAYATLAKYNLSLDSIEKKDADPRGQAQQTYYGRPWARSLSAAVADLFFCKYVFTPARQAKDIGHYFIGRESNAITASEMARWLVNSIVSEGRRHQRAAEQDNNWFRVFCYSAASMLIRRIVEMRDKPEIPDAAPGTSLVLASVYQTEQAENDKWIKETWKNIRQAKPKTFRARLEEEAIEKGRSYGQSLPLNKQLEKANG